jgi:putative ABC transport system permease protein
MRRIALHSLAHDRGKLAASLAGVAFAAALVLIQFGLYVGFLEGSSATVSRMGGDVWVMARGTQVVDNGEALSPGTRPYLAAHPCVRRLREFVMAWVPVNKRRGSREVVMVLGAAHDNDAPQMPWSMVRGAPSELEGPQRVSIDVGDVDKLQLVGPPLGAALDVNGQTVYVAALTRGIRAFTLAPYLFTSLRTARVLAGMSADQVTYWVVDLNAGSCRDEFIRHANAHPDLVAHPTARFVQMTQDYWVGGSGVGSTLMFAAVLGLIIGIAIVGQTLYAMTKEHRRELATLKALGATRRELVSFVAWQAGVLACAGIVIGLVFAAAVRSLAAGAGLAVVLNSGVIAGAVASIFGMCALASAASVRAVLTLDAVEVFR